MRAVNRDHPRETDDDPILFGVVGAGRVGSALATALVSAGHQLVAVCGRGRESESEARRSDFVIVAVPDDALAGVVDRLATVIRPGQVIAHTSGIHGLAILEPLTRAGAIPLALHPAMTFTGTPEDLERLARGIPFGVTAAATARELAQRVVHDLHGWIEWIDEDHRTLYHAAMTHGANHLVTLVNETVDLLRESGVTNSQAMLTPLLSAALANALRSGDNALTGPVSRGDTGTVEAHLSVLHEVAPESVSVYGALARRTVDRALAAGRLTATEAAPLLDLLSEREKSTR